MHLLLILFYFLAGFLNPSISLRDANPDMVVKIQNLRNKKGKILISLFSKSEGFPKNEKRAFKTWVEKPIDRLVLKNVPSGKYALALVHDEDEDFKMTLNLLGIPKEGFGFSTFKSSLLNIPDFKQATFEHKKSGTTINIRIVY